MMDLDTALSAALLVASLVAFFAVSVLEGGLVAFRNTQLLVGSVPGQGRKESDHHEGEGLSSPTVESLRVLRAAAFAASLVTAAALTISVTQVSWPWLALASALTLALLTILGSASQALIPLSSSFVGRHVGSEMSVIATVMAPWLAVEGRVERAVRRLLPDSLTGGEAGDALHDTGVPLGFDGLPLDEREVRMIRAVVRQDQTVAREIMVPRVDVSAVEISTPVAEVAERMIESGHSKLPVYREKLDQVAGFVYSMDLIRVVGGGESGAVTLEDLLRQPLLIPESKTLEGLLREFQDQRVQMAVVVDEYGGVSGVVTVEDLLEEIVGEIEDEFDIDEPEIVDLASQAPARERSKAQPLDLLIDARIGVDQVAELTGVDVQGEGFDTLGGFVLDRLGRMPTKGDTVDYDGISIRVVSTAGRRLRRLRVTRRPAATK
jgi:CBS domain containing-hemolysin-like protein